MRLETVGEIVAVRNLVWKDAARTKPVQVLVGKPRKFPDGEAFYCPWRIVGQGSEQIRYAVGADAVQALQLVMPMIGAALCRLQIDHGGQFDQQGESGGHGFPESI